MSGALLVVLLTQTGAPPGVAVVVSRRTDVGAEAALAWARDVTVGLQADGVEVSATPDSVAALLRAHGAADSASCEGESACLVPLCRLAGAAGVVGVEVGEFDGEIALHLEAFSCDVGNRLGTASVVLTKADGPRPLAPQLKGLAEALRRLVPAAPTRAPAPAPIPAQAAPPAVAVRPRVTQPVDAEVREPLITRPRVGIVALATAGVLGLVGAGLGIAAQSHYSTLQAEYRAGAATYAQDWSGGAGTIRSESRGADILYGMALLSGGAGAVLLWTGREAHPAVALPYASSHSAGLALGGEF